MRLILASASARRRELLEGAGVIFHTDPVVADESRLPDEAPDAYVMRVARAKVHAGRVRHPADVVLGADTVVVVDGAMLGKPVTDDEAAAMLTCLSGRAHEVLTGVAIGWSGQERVAVERTQVWFAALSAEDIRGYVLTGEPRDKAGAYAIQGLASRFVVRIEGSYSNVVGLPVAMVLQLLRETGLNADLLGPAGV